MDTIPTSIISLYANAAEWNWVSLLLTLLPCDYGTDVWSHPLVYGVCDYPFMSLLTWIWLNHLISEAEIGTPHCFSILTCVYSKLSAGYLSPRRKGVLGDSAIFTSKRSFSNSLINWRIVPQFSPLWNTKHILLSISVMLELYSLRSRFVTFSRVYP